MPRASAHQILRFEVVLQDHCKTPRLHDGQGELITTGLEVMWVLLAAVGNVEDLNVNL
jgi:hypothetical protein